MRKILFSIACLLAVTVKADNINVATQAELAALASSSHAGDVITLTADIALTFGSGEYWTPIGTFSTPFEGTFDGNGHTISGISIDFKSSKALYAGLFGYVGTSGMVQNVVVAGSDYIYSNGDGENTCYVGAIAGYNKGTIQYCGNTAPISAFHNYAQGGGIVGTNVKQILRSECDYLDWYCDRHNVRCRASHHDGTNYYLYRVAKNREQAERLINAIAYHGMTEEQFRKATKSLRPYVAKVYGW